jgi:hypothetical protein
MKYTGLAGLAAGSLIAAAAQAVVVYDGAVNTLGPTQSGYLTYAAFPLANYLTLQLGSTRLTTSGNAGISAGWSNYTLTGAPVNSGFPVLNPAQGFALEFNLQILAAAVSTEKVDDRGGFSVILLGSDKKGVEIAFQSNRLFALKLDASDLFVGDMTKVATVDTSVGQLYRLAISGSTFTLSSGSSTLLSGDTYDYTPWVQTTLGVADPYDLANYMFLGDDTTSASSTSVISYIAVPEPSGIAAAAMIGAGLLRRRRAR